MKKSITISIVLLCFFSQKVNAQKHVLMGIKEKDTLHVKVGFTLVPSGSMSLEKPGEFSTSTNIFGGGDYN